MDHVVADRSGMKLFRSGTLSPGGSYVTPFFAAGTFSIGDALKPTSKQTMLVSPVARPQSGDASTTFSVQWASQAPPASFLYDVQLAYCSATPCTKNYLPWRSDTRDQSATFDASDPGWHGPGQYFFRARIRNITNGAASGWSPPVTISVG